MHEDSGGIWLDQLWQGRRWLGASAQGETGASWLVLCSQLNWWDLNLRMVPPSPHRNEHLSALGLVILKVSGGKLRHVNGDS